MIELARTRLVMLASANDRSAEAIKAALTGGDVASVILYANGVEEPGFSNFCESVVPLIQEQDAAALIVDDTRVVGRSGADGIMLEKQRRELEDMIARFSPHNIVGCGGFKDRHGALEVGEHNPHFIFFGKTGGDIRPEPHRKNLALANWWSELVEIPCVVMGGNQLESIVECSATGADFVGLETAIFENPDGPANAVRHANRLLDENAPRFDEASLEN